MSIHPEAANSKAEEMAENRPSGSLPTERTVLSDIHDMLEKLAAGDVAARMPVQEGSDAHAGLKKLLNKVAEDMEWMVRFNHELAIGISEHYETLNQISRGDFTATAPEASENELLAQLGVLINRQSSAFCDALARKNEAEDALQSQLSFLETLLETIPNPIFYKDTACRYLGCNKAFEEYVGYPRSQLIGKTPHEIWSPELADKYLHYDLSLLENPGLQTYEATVRYADGSLRNVIFNKAAFYSQNGSVAGLVGVILDITERKKTEEELKFQNLLLLAQQEITINGILVVDEHGRIISRNRRFLEIMNIPPHLWDYTDDEPVLKAAINQVLEPDVFLQKVRYLYQHREEIGYDEFALRDGKIIDRYSAPIIDSDGRYYGRVWYFQDITDQKRSEAERSRFEAQRHHSRLMESFLIQFGHDLRTPITPLFTLLPLIREKTADPTIIKMADICSRSAEAINELTNKALKMVKLSASSKGELAPMTLATAVDDYIAMSREHLELCHVSCENGIDPALTVIAVPEQLQELFCNLISNAARYSHRDGVIRVSAESAGDRVTVAVHDDGIGIAPANLENIFDEFFKADESRHDLTSSGLGLSICRRIVANHNGTIWAESPGSGGGTTIRFTLPLQ